jgi:hypothetical protein
MELIIAVADELHMWWRDLERKPDLSRMDLLLFLAYRKRKAARIRGEDADERIIAQQKAEAISALKD